MQNHWIQDIISTEEIVANLPSNCSTSLIARLRARIARRHGRPRRRMPASKTVLLEVTPLNEAA